jgi:hypothetical protein
MIAKSCRVFGIKDRARDRPEGCPIRLEAIAFQPRAARMRYFFHHLYMAQLYRMFDLRDRWLVQQLQAFPSLRLHVIRSLLQPSERTFERMARSIKTSQWTDAITRL